MAVPNLTLFELAGILRADDADAAKPPEVVLQRLHGSRPRTVWELGAGAGRVAATRKLSELTFATRRKMTSGSISSTFGAEIAAFRRLKNLGPR